MAAPRDIRLRVRLKQGDEHELTLAEDSAEIAALYAALAVPEGGDRFLQLPLAGGRAALSFRTSQVASIVSEPPVVLELPPIAAAAAPGQWRRARFVIIDDFLGPREYLEMLALALASEAQFGAGTVTNYDAEARQNQVIAHFGDSVHSRLIQNRLLVWLPVLAKTFGMPMFPVANVESQLTAAGDGQFFRMHADSAAELPRMLSCVHYMHREPRGFVGGELRLYDCIETQGNRRAAETYTAVDPRANRMVVFPSVEFHEAMPVRCPSRDFADSRFAITSWIHRADRADPQARHGWGHFRCGTVAPQFVVPATGESAAR